MTTSQVHDFADDFRRAKVVNLAAAAPKDGTPIAARNVDGETYLIRWRTGADLEESDEPYWARYDTDEPFDFVDWIPSPLTIDRLLDLYG